MARLCAGGTDATAYRISHWHCIDAFIYFSHHLVTIPPPGWMDAAHRHAVPVSLKACKIGHMVPNWQPLIGSSFHSHGPLYFLAWLSIVTLGFLDPRP
jgi:endo-beta-N-acetylglucosaminidase D